MRKFVKKFSAEKQEKKDSSIKNSGAGQDTGKIKKKKQKNNKIYGKRYDLKCVNISR